MPKEGFDSPHWNRDSDASRAPRARGDSDAWHVITCVLLLLSCFAPIAFGAAWPSTLPAPMAAAANE